jgi:hypothetical protein
MLLANKKLFALSKCAYVARDVEEAQDLLLALYGGEEDGQETNG